MKQWKGLTTRNLIFKKSDKSSREIRAFPPRHAVLFLTFWHWTWNSLTNRRVTPLKSNFQFIRKVFLIVFPSSPFVFGKSNDVNCDRGFIPKAFAKDNDNDYNLVRFVFKIEFADFSIESFWKFFFLEKALMRMIWCVSPWVVMGN